ncbi:MAG: sigma-70 family RNA polymerase sigma factor [Clostridia bacterium]|nr:sigma-70 family RNA polymerase sigma factor [Clostridia bacterium]
MNDKKILDMLWQRDEKAIDAMQLAYGKYCRYVAMRIVEDEQDADEILNDTWLCAWNTIPPQHPDPLKGYLGALAHNLAIDRYRERYAQKRTGQTALCLDELAECVPADGNALDEAEHVHLRDTLNAFLSSLPQKTRRIFLGRYWYNTPLSELANTYGMRENAVANLLLRTRKKLKQTLEKEGFFL